MSSAVTVSRDVKRFSVVRGNRRLNASRSCCALRYVAMGVGSIRLWALLVTPRFDQVCTNTSAL
jgi:hypothetical protein